MSTERRSDRPSADRVVDDAWRASSREEPPARLDATILAAARAEAQRPRRAERRAWWAQWQPLAAAASVAALAFLVVQLIPRDEDVAAPPALERREPAPEKADALPAAGSAEDAVRAEASPEPVEPRAEARPAPMSAEAVESTGVTTRDATPARATEAPPPSPPTPEEWAQRIADLHRAGSPAAAAAELRAFRETYPGADRYLPADLRPWAATVPD